MRLSLLASIALIVLTTSCDLPRDADGTLDRVRGGVLRVGVAENSPWTMRSGTTLTGIEVRLVDELARELGARPSWRVGAESAMLAAVETRQVDLMIGGLTTRTPWVGRVALTHPYEQGSAPTHVMATPPGENAWLVHVEKFLKAHPTPGANSE